ncbi:MAG: HlyD family efflux transporter periplasmic adaptor subunit [Aquificae bacterium]|nr:HlyD family efflux transporter periplasmic adaptor subunit [Aquificota bacterium]
MKRVAGLFLTVLLLLIGGIWAYRWVEFRLNHVISNAVFVESDTFVKVAFKRVGGRLKKTFKEEGDYVKKGEVLALLERKDYEIKLREVSYEIEALEKKIEALEVKKEKVEEKIKKALEVLDFKRKELLYMIEAYEEKVGQLERDYGRFKRLYERGVVPRRRYEEAETALRASLKELQAYRTKLRQLEKEREKILAELKSVREIDKNIDSLRKRLRALLEKRKEVETLLEYTVLKSPIEGYVVKKFFKEGEIVAPGRYVYAIYNPRDVYILVLLDERKLSGVKVGSRARIKIDAFPERVYEGVVKEINMAVASRFAVIPRDITAGEFTKVAQRVPVKIEITKGDRSVLRLGMSGEVVIEKR